MNAVKNCKKALLLRQKYNHLNAIYPSLNVLPERSKAVFAMLIGRCLSLDVQTLNRLYFAVSWVK